MTIIWRDIYVLDELWVSYDAGRGSSIGQTGYGYVGSGRISIVTSAYGQSGGSIILALISTTLSVIEMQESYKLQSIEIMLEVLLMSYIEIIFMVVFNYCLLKGQRQGYLVVERDGIQAYLYYNYFAIMMEGKEERQATAATNTRKIKYFIERTDNPKPELPSVIPITQLAREYLNDDDFTVLIDQQNVFTDQEVEKNMEEAYRKWTAMQQGNCDIDDFLVYWIQQSPHLHVHYSLFDDIEDKEEVSYKLSSALEKARRSHPFIKKGNKKIERITTNPSVDKSQISIVKSLKKLNREEPQPKQLLQKFFIFYSKKQVNSNSIDTFNRYEQECSSLNLTKWMRYCRDVGLMRFKKTLTNKRLKEVFVKHEDKDKMLGLEQFQAAVEELLKFLFNNDECKVKEVGYELIGIKNQQNFQRKFQEMGELPPNYCLNKVVKKRCNGIVSKTSLKSKLDNGLKDSKIAIQYTTIGSEQPQKHISSFSLPKVKQPFKTGANPAERNSVEASQVSRKFQSFLKDTLESHDTTISRMLNKRTIKERQEILSSIINEPEDDPYLKRYNDKENLGRYRCVANRIDERIEKIQGKY